ncbi:eosinophil peroxidase [Coregonus clupeaformis]|uniref:eosinophil peroxidase n=1 Tax=Coregonus clupeaformis TaxID=59861 RepID=UPI001BE0BA59|nr:eosinophil peroxidase [Coregonus clupeaformis]
MDTPPMGLLLILALSLLCCLPHPATPTGLAHNGSGVPYLSSTLVEEALKRALERTNAAYAHTNERVKASLSEGAVRPSDLLAQFKQIGPQTRSHIKAAELLDNTVELIREMVYTSTMPQSSLPDLLSEEDMQVLLQATGCSSEMQRPLCKTGCLSERYRSFTGECNNRQHPKWGAANTPYSRWLPPEYEDVRGVPRGWDPEHTYYNYTLPPVRLVSQDVLYTHNENISLDSSLSHLLVEWGQWIDHDFALTPQSPSTAAFRTGADCTRTCSRDTPCFPIQIPLSDPRTGIQSCMPFFRSAPSCVGSGAFPGATLHHHREQLNAITSFVDASMVYGSSSPLAAALRNHSSPLGLLALNDQASDQGLGYLPYLPRLQGRLDPCGPRSGPGANTTGATSASETSATAPTEQENITSCFQAGDSRANEHLGMIALHTLFLREHNRLVRELHLLNPHWSPDTLYQEARKIMGAVHQILTWEHYLPRVLGETTTSLLMPPYGGYDPETDPSIANVFSAAAFRFAHVTVQPMVARLGPGYSLAPQHPPLPLHHSLFASWRVVQEGGIDPVLRGLLLSPAKLQMPGQMMVEELTERLFQAQGGMPLDLGALNLQRGRDHGLPGYSSWRGLCGLSVPNTTSDLAGILGNPGLAEKFLLLYGTSQNIDVWVGAISEPPLPGGRVGPLLACLLARQFRALRDGDRFWWERDGVFTSTQRAHLHTVSLSRIICDNTHITRVPSDPFSRTVSPEDMLACSHPLIPHLNLSAWKEPDTDPRCGPVPRLQSGYSLLCDAIIYYQCGPGYQLIGPSSVTCDPNNYQWSPAPPTCHDVDECADQPNPCPQNMDCLNTPGAYTCTELDLSSSHSAVSVISAVIAVVGGVAVMFMILACCRRYFPKKPEPINRTDKQN